MLYISTFMPRIRTDSVSTFSKVFENFIFKSLNFQKLLNFKNIQLFNFKTINLEIIKFLITFLDLHITFENFK